MPPMPDMSDAFFGWDTPFQFAVIQKTAVNFQASESKLSVSWMQGVLVPIPPRKLLVKPEGERKWKWGTLYSPQKLEVDWIVKDLDNKEYRVMSDADWSSSGFFEYEIAEQPK
jgi:hypothetical protein